MNSTTPDSQPNPATVREPHAMRRGLVPLVLSGFFGSLYAVGVNSPAATDFFRELGATEFQFGLISGLPLVMILMQFVGAAVLNRVARRKPIFVGLALTYRLLYLGVAFLPLALRRSAPQAVMPVVIVLLALIAAASHFASPFCFSWVADLVPRRVMNRVWGWRQRVAFVGWTLAYLGVTWLLYSQPGPTTRLYPLLVAGALAAGAVDILLYLRLPDPPNAIVRDRNLWHNLLEPARDPLFKRFIAYACFWEMALQFGSVFLIVYSLKILKLPPYLVMLYWSLQGIGNAIASGFWGQMADRFGHRPVLRICVGYKPMLFLGYLLVTPDNMYWLIPLLLFPDGLVNAGYGLANQGYLLTMSPQRNRSMFIAAQTGLAGICGGLSVIVSGALLERMEGFSVSFWGRTWINYHVIFAVCALLRMATQIFAARIHEPGAARTRVLIRSLLDESPLRSIHFPVGLFRRWNPFAGGDECDRRKI